jgi:hypothetical protein
MARITGLFDTRREAEMSIERLVQDRGFDRRAIAVMPEQSENSAGTEIAGADAKRGEPVVPSTDEAALNGRIAVSLDAGEDDASEIRAAFEEFGAADVTIA